MNEDIEDEAARLDPDRGFQLQDVRVLVVEDEPDTRELLTDCLERIGASVLALPSAEEALRAFAGFVPDVVLSDLSLPHMGGFEMLRLLRATEAGLSVPAMALSASASHDDAARAIAAGFDAHLAKPVSGDQLVRAVLSIVDTKHGD